MRRRRWWRRRRRRHERGGGDWASRASVRHGGGVERERERERERGRGAERGDGASGGRIHVNGKGATGERGAAQQLVRCAGRRAQVQRRAQGENVGRFALRATGRLNAARGVRSCWRPLATLGAPSLAAGNAWNITNPVSVGRFFRNSYTSSVQAADSLTPPPLPRSAAPPFPRPAPYASSLF